MQQVGGRRAAVGPVPTQFGVGLQRTILGVRRGLQLQFSAGVPERAETAVRVVGIVPLTFGTNLAADLEAGFGARDEEVAGAVSVADTDVFKRLRFSSDDSVGRVSTGNYCQCSSGAEKKALDIHFVSNRYA
ncbi:hypothetical protein GFPCMMHI_05345 [Ensifer adhaerens]|nr:hypothetical protein [Ensifer adhaerens]